MSTVKRFVAAGAAALMAGLGLQVTLAATASAATPAASAVANLMQSYPTSTGLIGGGWWTSAIALSSVETYHLATGDTTYDYAIAGAFNNNKSGNFENDYLDDTGWWGLAWMQAYDITGSAQYLQMAETDAGYLHSYWDNTCNGGVWWSTAKAYKNAIPNELFLQLTAGLHNRVAGDTTYLGWANSEWSWFSNSGMINSSNLVNDGLTSGCANNGQQTWTYNQGVILSGLAELYKATGNAALLTKAEAIANAATTKLASNGVLREPCEPSCSGDAVSFKGPFIRGLKALAVAANTTAYNTFLQAQSDSIVAHDTNSAGGIGENWAGPVGSPTSQSQAAGVDALVAALNPVGGTTPPPPPPPPPAATPIKSGLAGKCLDVNGGNATDGTSVQLWDCNGTVAQNWTVGSGSTLQSLGKCLDITAAGTANGTKVELWTCNGGANQVWNAANSGYRNPASGRCLDDPNASSTNGTQQQIYDCNGTPAQQWSTPGGTVTAPPPPVPSGAIKSGLAGKCLDDDGGAANGTPVIIWDCNGGTNQSWTFSGTTLQIAGRCADATAAGTANGVKVELWTCNGGGNQVWNAYNGGYRNPASGRCLDDPGATTTNGTQQELWDCNGTAAQKWTAPGA